MENKRAKTFVLSSCPSDIQSNSLFSLEVLSKLIQSQRSLLSRTQSDIERLQDLRHEALTQPTAFLSDLGSEVCFLYFLFNWAEKNHSAELQFCKTEPSNGLFFRHFP
jgi:hypothetical protein